MGFLGTFLGILGFCCIGTPIGLLLGFFLFIYSYPSPGDVQEPEVRPLHEMDTIDLQDIFPEIPLWVKSPDYERMDWFNKLLSDMWPYLDKAVCSAIKTMAQPMFAEYVGQYSIESIEFEHLTLGTLPPVVHGLKVHETNEKDLVMEPAIRWAGSPNIILVIKVMSLRVPVQLVDLQVFLAPRIAFRPLVPTFPCFANIAVSLMERPHVDFGLKVMGGDVMSIPGLYRFLQETIKKQVAFLYLWPQTLEIPILDASSAAAAKKPVGILHVNVVRGIKLLKSDFLGKSDPYVKLSLTGEKLPSKKTTIKKNTLNPEWNEHFKLIVKDPASQVLQLQVFDWDKVGGHDRLGMQMIPLKMLAPREMIEFTLDLLKHTNSSSDPQDKKQRGQLVVELTFVPFKKDSSKFSGPVSGLGRLESIGSEHSSGDESFEGAGVLSVAVQGAEDVEGERHNNPYAVVLFRGERKKTKTIRKTRDPVWNEEFQFMLDQPPVQDKIRIEVRSRRLRSICLLLPPLQKPLGHVEINLSDVVHNGRINEKYYLIDSKNGKIHVELRWSTV